MDAHRRPPMDRTPALLVEGHAWLPNRMRDGTGSVPRTRLLGRPAPAVRGPEAVRFFYDESHVHRHGAVPAPVLDTLFGQGPPLLPVRPVPRRPDRDGADQARRVRPGGRDPAARRLRAERRGTVGRPVRLPAGAVPGPATRPDELVPQGGGAPAAGHRCPASASPSASLESLAVRLARPDCTVPAQELRIPLRRIPTRPRSGFVVTGVRAS
ncbi:MULTISPECIES: hypothetical protein [Streptomyces]|uniref:hypothetical protein n=1 Tax=Streptomyces TaxID=1883 RepID=UPI0035A95F29